MEWISVAGLLGDVEECGVFVEKPRLMFGGETTLP